MKLAVAFCCVLLGCARANLLRDLMKAEWLEYKTEHRKEYATQHEELKRFQIYNENKLMITEHNKRYAEGKESYEMGLNQFSDLTDDEFSRTMLMSEKYFQQIDDNADTHVLFKRPSNFVAPKVVDWRKKGAVTPVKNQGLCLACWAFAATGVLEAALYKNTKKLISLSEQNLMDCDKAEDGCEGGLTYNALRYTHKSGGIESSFNYPYAATVGQCSFNAQNLTVSVKFVGKVPSNDEDALRDAVATIGPIAVVFHSHRHFHQYKSGIFHSKQCRKVPNHAFLVVGYGEGYWLVKNDWGAGWGDKGYVKIARGKCNLAYQAVYAMVN